jgi:hypothetical protein
MCGAGQCLYKCKHREKAGFGAEPRRRGERNKNASAFLWSGGEGVPPIEISLSVAAQDFGVAAED